jgi:fused signal recognition particle receptor
MDEHEAPQTNTQPDTTAETSDRSSLKTQEVQPVQEDAELSTATNTTQDPWDFLMNAGSDGGTWVLLGGPFLILVLIGCVYGILIAFKRRKENQELKKQVEEAENPDILPLPTPQRKDDPSQLDIESLTGQPIKPFKIPKELASEELEPPESFLRGQKPRQIADVHVLYPPKVEPPSKISTPTAATPPSPAGEAVRKDQVSPPPSSLRERLRQGLSKTRDAFQSQVKRIFSGSTPLDDNVLEQLHETLYRADFGVETADQMVAHVKTTLRAEALKNQSSQGDSWQLVEQSLRQKTADLLKGTHDKPLTRPPTGSPWVILIVGVNGVGKTTTIGKLAGHFKAEGLSCLLVAADTFRAAAAEQLGVWGQRIGVDVIRHQSGADPAAVAFDGIKAGIARKSDVILIDTAGRLHAKTDLMAELGKINRILSRDLPGAPHETWLVIDATTGQNAVQQVKAFKEVVDLSGLVVTKLDGTAKGGVIVGITQQFKIPVRYIGIGEKQDDLKAFSPDEFAESLF